MTAGRRPLAGLGACLLPSGDRHHPEVNPPVNPILAIGQILLSIALIAAILLQARGTGLSGTFGGDSAVYRSRRGIERRLWQFTIVLLVLFILFALVVLRCSVGLRPAGLASHVLSNRDMSITRRDGAVVAALVLSLVVLGGVLAVPAAAPAANTPEPTATPDGAAGRSRTARASSATPATIMPVAARTRSERTLVGLIFSGLVRLGPGNTYEPDLAESWTTDAKGKTWTFTLRDDATWQDGEPVTAEDVVFTVEALKSPDVAGAMAAAWADVTATAIDAKTVQFKVATPIAGFLAAATQPLLPAHLLSDVPLGRPRHERLRADAGRHGPLRAHRARRHDGRARRRRR